MKAFILAFFLFGFVSAAEICSIPINETIIQKHITGIVETDFPELQKVKIEIKNFKSNAYFLQANLKMETLLNHPLKRTYVVEVNHKLYGCPPTTKGLVAILVHELQHVSDYTKMSSAEVVSFAAKYSTNKKFRTKYERETDLKAMEKGFGKGLIDYRNWIYQWLTPKELKNKKRYYYSPEEIQQWMEED